MIARELAENFAAEWIEAWNSHDLERVLSHYTEDFEFSSPFIVKVAGEPSGILRGRNAVRAYWAKALALRPELRFELASVYAGVESIVIHYRRHDGNYAAEYFELDAAGKVRKSSAHYVIAAL
jgi:ketosteroid isomerase-like protein